MISFRFQSIALIICLLYFLVIGYCLKKSYFKLRYALVWLLSGAAMVLLSVWPRLLNRLSVLLGIYSSVNALFVILFACIILVLILQTIIISRQSEKIKRLTQTLALIEKRLRDVESEKTPEKNKEQECKI